MSENPWSLEMRSVACPEVVAFHPERSSNVSRTFSFISVNLIHLLYRGPLTCHFLEAQGFRLPGPLKRAPSPNSEWIFTGKVKPEVDSVCILDLYEHELNSLG
jgi:hypothetical protein